MSKKYNPHFQRINEIYVKTIIFEKDAGSSIVTLFGYFNNTYRKALLPVDYICEFSTLTDLLLAAKERGEAIITVISEKLHEAAEEFPVVIEVEKMLNVPLHISCIQLKIYKPYEQDENGEWKEVTDNCYVIDEFESDAVGKVIPGVMKTPTITDCFLLLEMSYAYYLQLLKFDLPVKKAREKAGLKNKLLFQMAEINHNMINDRNT